MSGYRAELEVALEVERRAREIEQSAQDVKWEE